VAENRKGSGNDKGKSLWERAKRREESAVR